MVDAILSNKGTPSQLDKMRKELRESIVSIARCVFPVFVGPRTAVILCFVISTFGVLFFFTYQILLVLKNKNRLKHDRIGE